MGQARLDAVVAGPAEPRIIARQAADQIVA
jgi:hypothetical protein